MNLFGIKLFGKLSNAEIDAFARELAGTILTRLPPGSEPPAGTGKRAQRELRRGLEQVLRSASGFQSEHKLGVYGKARVANTFKWELRDKGYDDDFVTEATKALVLALN